MPLSRAEIEDALDRMDALRAESSREGDWNVWARCLSEDVEFHDTIYGTYRGREAVADFVVRVHAPFPHVRYERDWSLIDVDRAEVTLIYYKNNRLVHRRRVGMISPPT